MKVFISWSGEETREIAERLHGWLHDVLQQVSPWVSRSDLESGTKWGVELGKELESTSFGIILVTRSNVGSPWLNFEAGALSKKVSEDARVVPLTIGFSPAELTTPLSQFHGRSFTERDMRDLVYDINKLTPVPLRDDEVRRAFDMWWPALEKWYAAQPTPQPPEDADTLESSDAKPLRTETEMIQEILLLTRQISQSSAILPRRVSDLAWRVRNAEEHLNVLPDGVLPKNYVTDDPIVNRQQALSSEVLQRFPPLRGRAAISVNRDVTVMHLSIEGPISDVPVQEILDWGASEGLDVQFQSR